MHGHGKETIKHFEQMYESGVQPYDITCICFLLACSHASLVDEGIYCFALMNTIYKISTKLEHYTHIANLFGHDSHLHKAKNMAMVMPCKPHVAMWKVLFGACRIHGHVEMAK
jgi:hypothetical protein